MRKIWKEASVMLRWKPYSICMIITLFAAYGSLIINPTIGVDDTAWKVYFIDGVSPVMGRWVLYTINKIFPIAEYNPYFVEGVFLGFFVLSVTIWVVLFKRILKNHVSDWVYVIFGCAFLASPITSEVITYYLSNGICIGFGFTGMALLYLWDSLAMKGAKRFRNMIYSGLWLWIALGCYESFIIVYMVAICILYLFQRGVEGKQNVASVWQVIMHTFIAGVFCVLLRSVWVEIFIVLFSLQDQVGVLHYRGMSEIFSWFTQGRDLEELILVLKEFFVKYYVNAVVYKPITLLILGYGFLGLWALMKSVQKKDFILILAVVGAMLIPWILPLLEGYTTYYRTSQYIVLVNAAMVFAAALLLEKFRNKNWCKVAGFFLAVLLLYHEVHEMNYWLKVDQDKYEDACRTADIVAYEIIRDFDESLPICVVGEYEVPRALAAKSYCPLWSKKYMIAEAVIKLVDDDLLGTYVTDQGYRFAETPLLSVLKWGSVAFYRTDVELVKFWENRGFDLLEDRDTSHYAYANELIENGMPAWPEKGSIIQMDGYIIVNLDNTGR